MFHVFRTSFNNHIIFIQPHLVSFDLSAYALVICNHGPPTPGAGRGIAGEMSGVFTFVLSPQCGGNTRDSCYIGKKGGAMKT